MLIQKTTNWFTLQKWQGFCLIFKICVMSSQTDNVYSLPFNLTRKNNCGDKIIIFKKKKKMKVKETCLLNKYKETNCIFFFSFYDSSWFFLWKKNVNLKLLSNLSCNGWSTKHFCVVNVVAWEIEKPFDHNCVNTK